MRLACLWVPHAILTRLVVGPQDVLDLSINFFYVSPVLNNLGVHLTPAPEARMLCGGGGKFRHHARASAMRQIRALQRL